jgi:hypothetical protein
MHATVKLEGRELDDEWTKPKRPCDGALYWHERSGGGSRGREASKTTACQMMTKNAVDGVET